MCSQVLCANAPGRARPELGTGGSGAVGRAGRGGPGACVRLGLAHPGEGWGASVGQSRGPRPLPKQELELGLRRGSTR